MNFQTHLFLRKYQEILYICRIYEAVFRQFTSLPVLCAGLLHPFSTPVEGSTQAKAAVWPRGTSDGRRCRHLSTHSYHGTFQARSSEEPNPAHTLWEQVSTGTRHTCGRGRAGIWTGLSTYIHRFQLDFYSSQWISITEKCS